MTFEETLQLIVNNETLDYHLQGVIVHSGNTQRGHYYSFVKDFEENIWRKFNDKDVTIVSTSTKMIYQF